MNHHLNGAMVNDLDKTELHAPQTIDDVKSLEVISHKDGFTPSVTTPSEIHLDELKQLSDDLPEAVRVEEPSVISGDDDWKEEVEVAYRVDETPPFGLCLLLAFQVFNSVSLNLSLNLSYLFALAFRTNDRIIVAEHGQLPVSGA